MTTLRYYRSTDATITKSDTQVGTDAVAELAASGSVSVSVELTAPERPGTYYYGACVDAVADESDTSNNCSTSVPVNVLASEPQMQAQPDLVVPAPTVSDSTPGAGETFTLSATVRNDGQASAVATTLRYYRSTDATITTSDTSVGTDPVATLAAAGSSSQSVDLTAPATAGTYYYGACVDAVTDEADTTNNCSASVQVAVPELERPDLTVAAPSVSDSAPATGTQFTLSVTVSNDGTGAAAATTTRYYQSSDAAITTADLEVGTREIAGLAGRGSVSDSVDLEAPATPGTYYYGACLDAVSNESNTGNNCSTAAQVAVRVTVAETQGDPDVTVTSAAVSDSGPPAGTQFTLSATVRNAGEGVAAATTLRYYRSTDATITTSDTLVGTDPITQLAAAGSSSQSVDLTAPETAGTYYYGACVDAVTDEADTTNNCSASVQVAVPELERPDLTVAAPSVSDSAPATGTQFTLSVTVSNDGTGAAAATTLRYYRSTDATITTSDTLVGTDPIAQLAAAGSSSQSVDLTAPETAGTYYYGACVDAVTDEADTTNNCSASVQVTVPELERPDLTVAAPSVSDSAPATGTQFTLSVTVSNDGTGVAAATTLRYYRSTDATITTSDTLVGTDPIAQLAAAGSSSQSVDLTAPETAGTYYYGACVDAVTDEADTTNNCSTSVQVNVLASEPQMQALPDLVVPAPTVSDSTPGAGETFTLSATVRNDGQASAAATTLRYYRSTDATISTSDTSVGTDPVATLAAAGSSSQSVDLTAPATAGTYYYGACVDAVTDEADTTNNCSASVQVAVPEPKPDLAVKGYSTSVLFPEPGATFTVRVTVWNLGDKSSAATTLRWFRSTDATITTSDTPEGTDAVAELAASGNVDKTVELTAPASPGTYFYGACVDAVTGESDTTNNCLSTPITVRDTHLVGIYSVSNAVTEGMSVRFRVTATPPPADDLTVNLKYVEYATTEDEVIYYNWPPPETTVTITTGSSSTTLTVGTIDDSDADGNSALQAWVESGSGYTRDPGRQIAVVVVVDDDGPDGDSVLSITPVSTPVSEGTAVEFTVGANPAPTAAVTVGYRVYETGSTFSEALDAGWNPGTVTIGAGQTSATLSFGTVNDSTDEEDSEVGVTLLVDTYPDGVELGRPATAYVTVLDDD